MLRRYSTRPQRAHFIEIRRCAMSQTIILHSAGSVAVTATALLVALFQYWCFRKQPAEEWNAWGAGLSLSASIYAVAVAFQYNTEPGAPEPVLRTDPVHRHRLDALRGPGVHRHLSRHPPAPRRPRRPHGRPRRRPDPDLGHPLDHRRAVHRQAVFCGWTGRTTNRSWASWGPR